MTGSVDLLPVGIQDVTARIMTIQYRFGLAPTPIAAAGGATAGDGAPGLADFAGFDGALAEAAAELDAATSGGSSDAPTAELDGELAAAAPEVVAGLVSGAAVGADLLGGGSMNLAELASELASQGDSSEALAALLAQQQAVLGLGGS